ncbi:MAG: protein kinase [Planctomyces sp.]|nr:protein kinase [Planctomyces sp.]
MSLRILCPACGQLLKVKDSLAGKTVPCPACKVQFAIPGPAAVQPSAAASDSSKTAPQETKAVQSQLGRFQIRAALGQGGFGTVYRAYDPILNREVALKVPRSSSTSAEQLITEARAAAPLRHPNIVAVYEAGAEGDDIYIVGEYVEGITLSDRIAQEPVDHRQAALWVQSLADALSYAHGEGIIHRDIKPANIMIGAQNRAQLMDFGLAVSESPSAALPSETGSGSAGTPAYMSPEQARGDIRSITAASDQYGLGAVLYELLTRQPPFQGGREIVQQIASGAQPLAVRSLAAAVPKDLEAICRKAIAPDPGKRYADCRALSEDLRRFQNGELVRARWYTPLELLRYWARKRPALLGWTAATVCLIALLLGGGIAWTVNAMAEKTEPLTALAPQPEATDEPLEEPAAESSTRFDVTSTVEAETILYGRQLDQVRQAFQQNNVTLADRLLEETRWDFRNWEYDYLRRIVTGGWRTLHGHSGQITAIAAHPNGQLFCSAGTDRTLRQWDLRTGKQMAVLESPHLITSLAYSPDGLQLAVATGIDTGRPVLDVVGDSTTANSGRSSMAASPAASFTPEPHPVILLNSSTLEQVAVYTEHRGPVCSLSFSSDGQWLVSGGFYQPEQQQGYAVVLGEAKVWDAKTLQTAHKLASPNGPIRQIAFLENGDRVIAAAGHGSNPAVSIWNLRSTPTPAEAAPINEAAPIPEAAAPAAVLDTSAANEAIPVAILSAPSPDQIPSDATASESQEVMPEETLPVNSFTFNPLTSLSSSTSSVPGMDVRLLEQGRRRVAGNLDSYFQWQPPMRPGTMTEASKLHHNLAAAFDVTSPAKPELSRWTTTAFGGGSPLLIHRPGTLLLHYPEFKYGAKVAYQGHRSAVTAVEFRPDGKQVITGDAEGTLRIWNAQTHPEVIRLDTTRGATRVAFGEDGRYVAVALRSLSWDVRRGAISSYDSRMRPQPADPLTPATIQIHDITNRENLLTLTGGPGDILGLAMTPDSKFVAAGGDDQHVRVWSTDSGSLIHDLPASGVVRCVAVSGDGQLIAASTAPVLASVQPNQPAPEPSASGTIHIWNALTGQEIAKWAAHEGTAFSVAFHPGSQTLASSGADGTVKIWNVSDAALVRTLNRGSGHVVDLAFRPGSAEIAAAAFDPCQPDRPGEVAIWNTEDGSRRLLISRRGGRTYGLTFSPDGRRLATCGGPFEGSLSSPGDVTVWDAETGIELLPLAGPSGMDQKQETQTYMVSRQITTMVPATEEHIVTEQVPVTKVATEEVQVEKIGDDGQPVTVTETRTKEYTTYETRSKTVTVCKPETQQVTEARARIEDVLWETPGTVLSIAFSPDGRSLAAACEDGSTLIWDSLHNDPRFTYRWTNGRMLCKTVSPDGRWIATGGDSSSSCASEGIIRVLDSVTGRLVREMKTPTGAVTQLQFLPDSLQIVAVTNSREWSMSTVDPAEPPQPPATITNVQWNELRQQQPENGHAELWDITTGEKLREIGTHDQKIAGIVVHPITGEVFTACQQSICCHDPETGLVIRRWNAVQDINTVALSADGKRLLAVTVGGKVLHGQTDIESSLEPVAEATSTSSVSFAPLNASSELDQNVFILDSTAPIGTESPIPDTGSAEPTTVLKKAVPAESSLRLVSFNSTEISNIPLTMSNAQLFLPATVGTPNVSPESSNSAQGSSVLMCDVRGTMFFVDPRTGEELNSFHLSSRKLSDVCTHKNLMIGIADERQLVVCDQNQLFDSVRHTDEFPNSRKPDISLERVRGVPPVAAQYASGGSEVLVQGIRKTPVPHSQLPFHIVLTNTTTGRTRVAGGYTTPVRGISTHPKKSEVAVIAGDEFLRVWSLDNATQLAEKRHSSRVTTVQYNPNGTLLATATEGEGLVWIWDATTLKEVRRIQAEATTVSSLAFHPDGTLLVTSGPAGIIRVWNVENGEQVREWSAHEKGVNTLTISGDGELIASGDNDGIVKIWTTKTGEVHSYLDSVESPIHALAFSPNDQNLAIGSEDTTVRIRNLATSEYFAPLNDHKGVTTGLEFSPDGSRLACCGPDFPIRIWNWRERTSEVPNQLPGQILGEWLNETSLVSSTVNGTKLPTEEFETIVTTHDPDTGRIRKEQVIPDLDFQFMQLSPDGKTLAFAQPDGTITIWNRENSKVIGTCRGHQGRIFGLAFNLTGNELTTIGQDKTLRTWSSDGKEQKSHTFEFVPTALAISPDDKMIAVGQQGGNVELLDSRNLNSTGILPGRSGAVQKIVFSPDGRFLVSTSSAQGMDHVAANVRCWDLEQKTVLLSTNSPFVWNASAVIHPHQLQVAFIKSNGQLAILNGENGKTLATIKEDNQARQLEFSPDGSRLLTVTHSQVVLKDASPEPRRFGTELQQPHPTEPVEEAAARWVLEHGGTVTVLLDHIAQLEVRTTSELPSTPYTLSGISLSDNEKLKDADLTPLHSLRQLRTVQLNLKNLTNQEISFLRQNRYLMLATLGGTQISDRGLAEFSGHSRLNHVGLYDTQVTSTGLQLYLGKLPRLSSMYLDRCPIDDSGLNTILAFPSLTHVTLHGTKVTAGAVEQARRTYPGIRIDY